jgi:hypothetical protein
MVPWAYISSKPETSACVSKALGSDSTPNNLAKENIVPMPKSLVTAGCGSGLTDGILILSYRP